MYLVVRFRLHAVGLAVDPDGLIVLVWHGAYSREALRAWGHQSDHIICHLLGNENFHNP